jgi:glycosyltransferase involved in cell wall biosynthesis
MGTAARLSGQRRVLFVSHSATTGGAQSVLVDVTARLGGFGFEPVVVLPEHGPLEARLGCTTLVTPLRWWAEWLPGARRTQVVVDARRRFLHRLTERVERLVRIAEESSVDAIVSNTLVIPDGALAAAQARLPHVWYAHEFIDANPDLRLVFTANDVSRYVGLLSDRVAAVSSAVRDELAALGTERSLIHVVHNGIDVDAVRATPFPPDSAPPTAAFVGALSERKGIDVLLEALARVQERLPTARLLVAGGATKARMRSLQETTDRLALTNVRFLGELDDVAPVIAQAHVVALPALLDPFPLAVLEAMAMRRAVVGTRSGGMAEQIADGVTGALVAPGDADELASALLRYLETPDAARRAGALGAERVADQFTSDKMVATFAELLDDVVAGTPPDRRDVSTELLACSSSHAAVALSEAIERPLRSLSRRVF